MTATQTMSALKSSSPTSRSESSRPVYLRLLEHVRSRRCPDAPAPPRMRPIWPYPYGGSGGVVLVSVAEEALPLLIPRFLLLRPLLQDALDGLL